MNSCTMKKSIIIPFIVLCAPAFAQNLNPEVQVTNDYVTKMMDVEKQSLSMSVPDSMLKFDYHFDYSVFESPYRGAYEFSPYTIAFAPEPEKPEFNDLYLSAGAGYSIHPELVAVWSPVHNSDFDLSVFGNFNGYSGNYNSVSSSDLSLDGGSFYGYDFSGKAGVEGRWNLPGSSIRFEAAYDGIFNGGDVDGSIYNSAYGIVKASSNSSDRNFFYYDANLYYRFLSCIDGAANTLVSELKLSGTVGPVIDAVYRILVDIDADANGYNTSFSATPRFQFSLGSVNMSAGVRLGCLDGFSIYPDVRATLDVFSGSSQIYGNISGRDVNNSFSSIKSVFHRYTNAYGTPQAGREMLDVNAGIRGTMLWGIQYDLKLGARLLDNAPLYGVSVGEGSYSETLAYADYNMMYAEALAAWKSERISVDGRFRLCYCGGELLEKAFLPSAFSGNAGAEYNISKRISFGTKVLWETSRKTSIPYIDGEEVLSLPGYADLGVFGKYSFARRWSVWAKGGNLLNMDIRCTPFYSEKGPYFTAGICLSL